MPHLDAYALAADVDGLEFLRSVLGPDKPVIPSWTVTDRPEAVEALAPPVTRVARSRRRKVLAEAA